jgi:two-component sensor histidine kinase
VLLQPAADGEVMLVVSDDGPAPDGDGDPGQSKTGLGLRIIKGLVAQLDGSMAVRRERGTSTEIRTAMPAQP